MLSLACHYEVEVVIDDSGWHGQGEELVNRATNMMRVGLRARGPSVAFQFEWKSPKNFVLRRCLGSGGKVP